MKKRRGFTLFSQPRNMPKLDKYGRSNRQLCFDEFDNGKNWHQVAKEHEVNTSTCRRYYQSWKKLPDQFEFIYQQMIRFNKEPGKRNEMIKGLSLKLNLDPEEVEQIMLRPWGLRSLLLATYGLKKINVKRSEREKAALLRMEREIRKRGLSIEKIAYENEMVCLIKEKILKMAGQRIEKTSRKQSNKQIYDR